MKENCNEESIKAVIIPSEDDASPSPPEKGGDFLNTVESIFSLICRNNEIIIMPKIMADCGLVGGIFIFALIASISMTSSYALCLSAQKLKVKSIIELCLKVFPQGSILFNAFLMTLMVGAIVCSQLLIVDTISEIMKIGGINPILANSYVVIACLNICMLFFIYSKTIQKIKLFSNVAFVGYFLAIGMIVFHYFSPFYKEEIKPDPNPKEALLWSTKGIVSNIGLVFFSFTTQDVIIDFDSDMRPQNKQKSRKFTALIASCLFMSYFLCGFFGYLSILRDPSGYDQENFLRYLIRISNSSSSLLYFANFTICLNLLFDSLVSLIPIANFIDTFWLKENRSEVEEVNPNQEPSTKSSIVKTIFTIFVAGILYLIVFFRLDVQAVYEIMSSMCIIPICVIFPLYFYHVCFPQSLSRPVFGALMGSSLSLWVLSILGCIFYL